MMDSFMNWRGMFQDEDNLEGNDRLHNKFLDIYVLHPRTHIKEGKAQYTDYEIRVKTNHPEFAIKDSKVRRRYSEFVWLKSRLGINDVMMVTAPSLPGKRYFGRFKDPFLRQRQMGLQHFMNKVVEVNAFLSDPALHFFLQSELPIREMEYYLHHSGHLSNIRDRVIAMQKVRDKREMRQQRKEKDRGEHTGQLKRILSVDSLMLSSKELDKPVQKTSGRGWSRFIGYGYHSFGLDRQRKEITEVDGPPDHFGFRTRSSTATARVLPGGQLCLAESDEEYVAADTSKPSHRRRPNSWHGKTGDLVDLWLDDYDIIRKDSKEMADASDIESMSISYASGFDNSASGSYLESSDDGIEVDISKRLSEYSIIASPLAEKVETTERESLFIHSGEHG